MTHTRGALGMLGAWLLLLVLQPPQAVADPPEPSAYCAQEDNVAQVLCMERETNARARLEGTRRGRGVAPGTWAACAAASSSWSSMEPCVVERRAATFSWTLWSFGGAVTDGGLVVDEGWTLIGGGYESIALCEEGMGAYVRSLSPASLRIERNERTSTGPADRFELTLRDGTHVSWRFSCMRGPTPFAQSP